MAITINRRANVDGDNLYEYDLKGLSTDTKPTQIGGQDIEDNSLFLELDTGDFYYLSGGTWVKIGEAPTPPTPSEATLEDKISNTPTLEKSANDYLDFFMPFVEKGENDEYVLKSNVSMQLITTGTYAYNGNGRVSISELPDGNYVVYIFQEPNTVSYYYSGDTSGTNIMFWTDESGELPLPNNNDTLKIILNEV